MQNVKMNYFIVRRYVCADREEIIARVTTVSSAVYTIMGTSRRRAMVDELTECEIGHGYTYLYIFA